MKKIIGAVCIFALLAACGKPKGETVQTALAQAEGIDYLSLEGITVPEGALLAMVGKDTGSDFWNMVKKGAGQAVADLNEKLGYSGDGKVRLLYDAPAGENVSEQTDIIDQMLDKNPDALCIGFVDVSSGKTQIELAASNGIPVLAVDSGVSSPLVVNICKTDNYKAGAEAAEKLCQAIGGRGKVALLVHSSQTETGIEREKGFRDALQQSYPEVELVDVAYSQQDERNPDEIVSAVLQENPDLAAYFGTNSSTTIEILDALAMYQPEESKVLTAGFDISEKTAKALEEGRIAGVMIQNPYGMGYAAAVASFRAMAGMENAAEIDTGHAWITVESIKEGWEEVFRLNF